MSSKSSTTSTHAARRSAAALGATAVLSMALAAPALAARPDDGPGNGSSAGQSTCRYLGGGSIVCTDGSTPGKTGGAGSTSGVDRGYTVPVKPIPQSIKVPQPPPSNLPVIGVGVATAVVVAGGVGLVAMSRRRPTRPA
ncbi:MAG: hypothetical protein ACKOVB_20785 [Terrabacter sp.]